MSYYKQESLNKVTNRWNNFNINYTTLDSYMWVNELCNINLKFKNTKANYDKDKNKLKAHVFDVLTEESPEL